MASVRGRHLRMHSVVHLWTERREKTIVFLTLCYKPQKWSGIEPLYFCIAHSGRFYVAFAAPLPARLRFAAPPIAPGALCGRLSPCSGKVRAAFFALAGDRGVPPFKTFVTSVANDIHNTTSRSPFAFYRQGAALFYRFYLKSALRGACALCERHTPLSRLYHAADLYTLYIRAR